MLPHHATGQPWSTEETQRLREMVESGMTTAEIAAALERTVVGIQFKVKALGMCPRPAKPSKRLPPRQSRKVAWRSTPSALEVAHAALDPGSIHSMPAPASRRDG